jgi:UDP-3-O-[3-hydroxymyristoyl] glucosamine N-acyltransferase
MKVGDIARALPAEVIGNALLDIRRVVHPADAEGTGDLAVALSKEAVAAAAASRAAALVVPAAAAPSLSERTVLVYGGDERLAIARLTAMFDPGPAYEPGIHATAVVAEDATVTGVNIGPHVAVGHRTTIGAGTTILANVTIGAGCTIGRDCLIYPGVVIGDRVRIGDRVSVFANAVIGADGFSYIPSRPGGSATPQRIHSLGAVIIGDDVEIGASTTIDRATLRDTRIGRGTKIDNQVQIGHNVVIGESCLICGMTGIAGSATIGDRVLLAASVGVSDHITIESDAIVGAMSGVARHVRAGMAVLGIPALPRDVWMERYANSGRLGALFRKVDDLRRRLESLEKPGGE